MISEGIPFLIVTARNVSRFSIRSLSTLKKRSLDVAVIGAPNVGKSLVTNQLVRAAVSAVSSKMDTTTQNVECVITEGEVQLCVVDSPGTIGLGHARDRMKKSSNDRILSDPEVAMNKAQHILVVQDATATGDYIHHRVLHLLHRHSHLTASLVINKVDLIRDRKELLELTRILTNGRVANQPIQTASAKIGRLGTVSRDIKLHDEFVLKNNDESWQEKYRNLIAKPTHKVPYMETKRLFAEIRGWSNFDAVFFASAVSGEGVDTIRNHLMKLSEEREWRQDEMTVTTKNPQDICVESIRASLLDTIPADIAYKLKPRIVEWVEQGEVLQILAEIPCAKEREGRLIIGKGGQRISEIGRRVNEHMHNLFQRQLFVRLLVKHNNKPIDFLSS